MSHFAALLAALALLQDPASEVPPMPVLRQIVIDLARHPDLDWRSMDVYIAPGPGDTRAHFLAADDELARLRARGVSFDVVQADQAAFYRSRLNRLLAGAPSLGGWLNPPFGQGSMGGYYTFAEVVSVLDQMKAAYPALMTGRARVGGTIEGRDIWMVKISDAPDVDENEPESRFDALHHAREPESMQATIWFMLFLLEGYGSDPLATWLVDNREMWFLPVVNPDGYVYNQIISPGGGGMWRKNRRANGGGSFGVDLNRNYPFRWGVDDLGSSPNPDSEAYRGTGPASEPEVASMTAFLSSRSFATALSSHTFSNIWLYPFGYDTIAPPNDPEYVEISTLQTEVNGYPFGVASIVLYLANGVTVDYDQGVHGTLSWTPEIGSSGDGFWPPTERIVPLAEENLLAFQRTALAAGAFVHVLDRSVTDQDGDGDFEPDETVELHLTVRNSGKATTAGSVTATLSTTSPQATVTAGFLSFGGLAPFTQASTGGSPLSLRIAAGAPPGTVVPYTTTVEYEGYVQGFAGELTVGARRPFLTDAVELDLGWTVGLPSDTAQTGLWEHGDPIGTSSGGEPVNPEDDLSPAPGRRCFVTGNGGGSAGSDDVDGGETTLITPRIDLSGVGPAIVSYGRWFADLTTADDVLRVAISNDDGSSWVPLEDVAQNANEWTLVEFNVEAFLPQTAEMRLRFVAADDPNNSLVEGAVDELRIEIFDELPRFNAYGKPQLGTPIALHVAGEPGRPYTIFFSPNPGSFTIPGVEGTILLDLSTSFPVASGALPTDGLARVVPTLPSGPSLAGQTFYLQALVVGSTTLQVTNRDEITLE